MKIKSLIPTLLIVFIVLGNLSSGFINLFKTYHYQTENAEFEFSTMPTKGRDIEMMERVFSDFKKTHPEYGNLQLFRTFKRNPLQFWNWYSYLMNDMYKYEYRKEVKSVLGNYKLEFRCVFPACHNTVNLG